MANVNFAKWVQMRGRKANPQIDNQLRKGGFPWLQRHVFWWEQRITVGDFTPESDMSQVLDLDALYPTNPFIDDVYLMPGAQVILVELFVGATTATLQLGDTNDPNGLITATNLHTGTLGLPVSTTGAAEYDLRPETGYLPIVTLTTTVENVDDITAGEVIVRIPWTPFRSV